jgi:hypothetical protein
MAAWLLRSVGVLQLVVAALSGSSASSVIGR